MLLPLLMNLGMFTAGAAAAAPQRGGTSSKWKKPKKWKRIAREDLAQVFPYVPPEQAPQPVTFDIDEVAREIEEEDEVILMAVTRVLH